MAEEENEAIEFIKSIININKENERTTAMLYVSDVDILLNLIEKLKKENEELRVQGSIVYLDYDILKDKIREKIKAYQNEIECEKSYLEQGIICEEEYKDRIKVYNSYIFILNKLLEEE